MAFQPVDESYSSPQQQEQQQGEFQAGEGDRGLKEFGQKVHHGVTHMSTGQKVAFGTALVAAVAGTAVVGTVAYKRYKKKKGANGGAGSRGIEDDGSELADDEEWVYEDPQHQQQHQQQQQQQQYQQYQGSADGAFQPVN